MRYAVNPDGTVSFVRPFRLVREDAGQELLEAKRQAQENFEGVVGDLESDDPDFESDTDTGGNA